jgi:hypothetical protein
VREFKKIITSSPEKSLIVITDFMENATTNEFTEFQKAFQRAGYDCEIWDMRELKYENGELKTPEGKKINAVYRRAVTCDVMQKKDEVQPFLQAVRDNAVCVVGHFRTQVIHNKVIFKILRMDETLNFLSREEREFVLRHVPETFELENGAFELEDVLQNKNEWLIKPKDLYGSRGVFAGADMNAREWKKTVAENIGNGYLLQKFCAPYKSENLDFNGDARPAFKIYNNITGLFVYNGELAGIYSRAGGENIISSGTRGMTMASVYEK